MMVFVFSAKVKSHCLGLAKTLNFSEFFKKFPFSVFLNDLEENIPNKRFLIFDFSWKLMIFRLLPRISEILKQALKWRIICSPCSFLSIFKGAVPIHSFSVLLTKIHWKAVILKPSASDTWLEASISNNHLKHLFFVNLNYILYEIVMKSGCNITLFSASPCIRPKRD